MFFPPDATNYFLISQNQVFKSFRGIYGELGLTSVSVGANLEPSPRVTCVIRTPVTEVLGHQSQGTTDPAQHPHFRNEQTEAEEGQGGLAKWPNQ